MIYQSIVFLSNPSNFSKLQKRDPRHPAVNGSHCVKKSHCRSMLCKSPYFMSKRYSAQQHCQTFPTFCWPLKNFRSIGECHGWKKSPLIIFFTSFVILFFHFEHVFRHEKNPHDHLLETPFTNTFQHLFVIVVVAPKSCLPRTHELGMAEIPDTVKTRGLDITNLHTIGTYYISGKQTLEYGKSPVKIGKSSI